MRILLLSMTLAGIVLAWSDGFAVETHKSCQEVCPAGSQACVAACECTVGYCYVACSEEGPGTDCSECSKKACKIELIHLTNESR